MKKVSLKILYFNTLEVKLDELFPKGKCKERGKALVLFAFANILFNKYFNQEREIK